MKNFDPVGYNRAKWADPKRTKNNPASCTKAHSFCNFGYEWADESGKVKSIDQPINPVNYFLN